MSEEDVKIESESKEDEKSQQTSKKRKYRKDKPWDNDSIDHWKPVSVSKEDPLPAPLEESSFATLFPKYREKYIREVWPLVTKTLKEYGVACELDLLEGSMTVKTTRKMWDPYAIMKARDLIKLLARSIPVQQALKIMTDEFHCDIIKIKNMVRNKERFAKRRQRLIGPNGCTLKAIELVTGCYVMVQGNTVSAMGPIKGLKHVRSIVEDCMKNVHPIYTIKQLMIKKELANDPKLKNENWDRFLPKFKKKNVKRKKKPIVQKEYTPFPPAQTPRKVDLLMESGEFFLTDEQKQLKKQEDKRKANLSAKEQKKAVRESEFVAPEEPVVKRQKNADGSSKSASTTDASPGDLAALMNKFKKEKNASKQEKSAQDYLLSVPAAASNGDNEPSTKKQKVSSGTLAPVEGKKGKRKGRDSE